ncbi:MAG: hypothetical protein DRI32_01580 [Chloroflexi bacterium]|nr:MAG: hypothetical protein DRI32_01580 [Chloroflexota bacterium]
MEANGRPFSRFFIEISSAIVVEIFPYYINIFVIITLGFLLQFSWNQRRLNNLFFGDAFPVNGCHQIVF